VKLFLSMEEAKALASILGNVLALPPNVTVDGLNGHTRAAIVIGYRLAADIEIAAKGIDP
jgi:hypothetical protein